MILYLFFLERRTQFLSSEKGDTSRIWKKSKSLIIFRTTRTLTLGSEIRRKRSRVTTFPKRCGFKNFKISVHCSQIWPLTHVCVPFTRRFQVSFCEHTSDNALIFILGRFLNKFRTCFFIHTYSWLKNDSPRYSLTSFSIGRTVGSNKLFSGQKGTNVVVESPKFHTD